MANKIMIVDDEPDVVDLVKIVLKSEGYEVVTATSGKEALEKIGNEMPDLVLLDIMMPQMDGWEVYNHIKSNTKTRDIPVAMLTAKSQSIDKMIGLHVVQVDDYITKPFGRAELLERVKKILTEKGRLQPPAR
ncbi:response regulator transcription factor [Methanocella arvoryzae]|uniref:Response regulator (CheY-like) n=1 Tax=Methanocella arvoryzae (strain DSM 22066 / NBRC 105507 / MRE50) TaxID=351160 RepID=Q0W6W7_METAR|nr:response regulator [Methanocella arvoryzae]CAJ35876.1 putative response regulator (CheY-like) [Methanocella arvoryzae MRE50]